MQTASPSEPRRYSPLEGFIPFLWLSLAVTGGVILAEQVVLPIWIWLSGFVLSLLLWGFARFLPKRQIFTHRVRRLLRMDCRLPGIMLTVLFFFGGWRYLAAIPKVTLQDASYFNDRGPVQMAALVISPPDVRDTHTNLTVEVISLLPLEGNPVNFDPVGVSGKVLLQVPSTRNWAYGDCVQVTGKLTTAYESGDFSYRDYLAHKGIHSLMNYARVDWVKPGQGRPIRAFIFDLRQKSYDALLELFPSPEADLLAGILLGRDQGLSQELQDAFRVTGMTHIIAISGFNITILAGLFSAIFTRILGRKSGALAAVLGISGYTLMVGGDAAVVRAAIIGTLGVLGGMFGRRQNGLNSLGLAAFAMVLHDPLILWDIGFQLSIAATLGLILYAQPLEMWFIKLASRWMSEERAKLLVGPISELFLFTIAAQLLTLPIMAYHFGQVSWLAFIANPLILPPQSLVMILGGLALLGGLILPGLGRILGIMALPFVRYTIRMVMVLSGFPGADLKLPDFHVLWLVLFYGLLFFLTLAPIEKRKGLIAKAFSPSMALLLLLGSTVFVWTHVLSKPDGNLTLTLLDHEGTLLIQSPDGKRVLIGGGPSPSYLNQVLGQALPPGVKKLDALVVASSARDDMNALTGALKTYSPSLVLWGVAPDANQTTAAVYRLLLDGDVHITSLAVGQSIELGSGVKMDVLYVGERGSLLWLHWNNFSALLPAGKITNARMTLSQSPDVVLLEDDLIAEDLSMEVINQWSPSVILVPLKESDLPLQGEHEILVMLAGYPVVTTLDNQWVKIATDGKNLWVTAGN
jgi:competence protein ComEC